MVIMPDCSWVGSRSVLSAWPMARWISRLSGKSFAVRPVEHGTKSPQP